MRENGLEIQSCQEDAHDDESDKGNGDKMSEKE